MAWASEHLRWFIHIRQHLAIVDARQLLQITAIICLVIIMSMIFYKGYSDISVLIEENPDDFWRDLCEYLINNLAGIGVGDLKKQ